MIKVIPPRGRCTLDRKEAFSTWTNKTTRGSFENLSEMEQLSFADLLEAAAQLSEQNAAFRQLWVQRAKEVKQANRKHPQPIEPTPEEIQQTSLLTPEEAYQHLDPILKDLTPKQEILEGLASIGPLDLPTLERTEDKEIEAKHQKDLNEADERATFFKGDKLSGLIKVSRNERRYAEEVKRISERRDRENAARRIFREERRALLGKAALLLASQLRQAGNPQSHRQYHDEEWREATRSAARRVGSSTMMSQSAWETEGGATRKDRREVDKALD